MKCQSTVVIKVAFLIFAAFHLVLGLTLRKLWVNLLYTLFVLVSIFVSRWFILRGIGWAILPYSNGLVRRNHEQEINR